MSYQVINPFIQFVDPKNGNPLSAGSIYFGRQDSDPKNQPANRINVYAVQDNGSEVLLSQPITLNGAGQPQYSGSVKQIKISLYAGESAYSIQLFNKSGSQKGYSPRVSGLIDVASLASQTSTVSIAGVLASHVGQVADSYVTPEQFGAVGDMVADDSTAIENWLASNKPLALIRLATYRLTREINMPANPIIIVGLGRLPVYAYELPIFNDVQKLPTFYIDHNGSDAFRFRQNSSARGSYFFGFNVIRKPGSTCIRAFGFDVSGVVTSGPLYGYDCTFERIGVFDFASAFDMYIGTTSIEPTMADITIKDSVINRNGWICRNLNGTAWNMFRFIDNKAGQQINGGLDISAHSVIESGNLLEGMPNPVKITGGYEGANLGGSYFEANTGLALYNIQSLRGPYSIDPCTILAASSVSTYVLCGNSSETYSPYQVVGEPCYNATFPNLDGIVNSIPEINTASIGLSYCSKMESRFTTVPPSVKTSAIYRASVGVERGTSPMDGKAMVTESFVTSGSPAARTVPIIAAANDYVVLTMMIKHTGAPAAASYFTVDVNGTNAAGSRDYSFGDEDLHIKKGDWKLFTVAVRPSVAVTSIVLRIYPYGAPSVAGINVEFSGITAYSCSSVNSVRPYVNSLALNSVTSTPATGTWAIGDILTNATPAAGGQSTFCFTSSGWVYG